MEEKKNTLNITEESQNISTELEEKTEPAEKKRGRGRPRKAPEEKMTDQYNNSLNSKIVSFRVRVGLKDYVENLEHRNAYLNDLLDLDRMYKERFGHSILIDAKGMFDD